MNVPAGRNLDRALTTAVAVALGVWLAALAGTLAAVRAQSPQDGSQAQLTGRLEARIVDMMARYAVPGVAVALVEDGEVVWSAAFGFADLEAGTPLRVDSLVRAESISKSVTAWAVMTLVEEGRVALDDVVWQHVSSLEPPAEDARAARITVRQLLSNTAGVGMGTLGREYPPDAERPSLPVAVAADLVMWAEPGERFGYSNTGFNLLELLVQDVTGEPFAEYAERAVLAPLGMTDSSYEWRAERAPRVAVGYDLAGHKVDAYVYAEKGSGGLLATVEDLARFVAAGASDGGEAGRGVLQAATVASLHEPAIAVTGLFRAVAPAYGLGHFVETLSTGERAVWHGGQGHGWMTDFHLVPSTGDGIVIVANSQRSWPLVAQVLADWSTATGFAPVGFALIARAPPAARVLAALLGLGAAWLLAGSVTGVLAGDRGLALRPRRWRPLLASLAGAALVFLVLRDALQDYSFLDSVVPGVAVWLRLAAAAFGAALFVSGLFPWAARRARQRR